MATNHLKTSPRKFSEKIALLNKKEAEGNAEFEEIIKEVQATKSQTASSAQTSAPKNNSRPSVTSNARTSTDRDELEEVFQNIIKYVGQYEQEIDLAENGAIIPPNVGDKSTRSASAGANCEFSILPPSTIPTNSLPLNQSPCINIYNGVVDSNGLSNIPCNVQSKTSVPGNLFNSQESVPSSRARVTSFGSADQKFVCINSQSQQPKYYCQDNWTASNEIYLRPAYDKSWQKSCSDPALHMQYTPSHVLPYPVSSQSENVNADSSMIDQGINIDEQQENMGPSRPYADIASGVCLDSGLDKSGYIDGTSMSTNPPEHIRIHHYAGFQPGPCDSMFTNVAQFEQSTGANVADVNFRSQLPGIKICTVDDDNAQMRSSGSDDQAKRTPLHDSSLPELSSLEFNKIDRKNIIGDERKVVQVENASFRQQQSTSFLNKCQKSSNWPQISTSLQMAGSNAVQFNQYSASQTEILYDHTPTEIWSKQNNAALYEPRVSGQLSNSEIGLTNQNPITADLSNNIMRSHSHGSIQHLMRLRAPNKYFVGRSNSPTNDQPQFRPNPSYGYNKQLGISSNTVTTRNFNEQDNFDLPCSSISPIDSSSNLTSPHSDINSPDGSVTEQDEYLASMPSDIVTLDNFQEENGGDNSIVVRTCGGTCIRESPDASMIGPQKAIVALKTSPTGVHQPQCRSDITIGGVCLYDQNQYCHPNASTDTSRVSEQGTMQEATSSIGPCQSPSSRRLHNVACRGVFPSFPPVSRGSNKN